MMRTAYGTVLLLCGVSSAFAQSTPASVDAVKAGAQVFHRWCVECHGPGQHPGTSALQRKYQDAIPAALEQRSAAQLPEALIRLAVRNGMSYMPFFRKTEVTDRELDALVAYLTSEAALRNQVINQAISQVSTQLNTQITNQSPK
jgi:mono/diheme cytochrome c family protein